MSARNPAEPIAPRDISTTLVKGLAVLAAFDDAHRDLGMPRIVEITGLDRASVRRLVVTLVHLGYLERTGRTFRLTPRILGHAGAYLRANRVGSVIQPVLNSYAEELGSSISLATLDGESALLIAQSTHRTSAISLGFTVGSRLPTLHTAIGRMLLGCRPAQEAREVIRRSELVRHTARTELDRLAIARSVATAAAQGWSMVSGEFEAGATGLAVPLRVPDGAAMALGVSEQGDGDIMRHLGLMQACASTLERAGAF
ncbi:helix-turn-helix domain-containing protein [Sulfitobacter sp. LCG007]